MLVKKLSNKNILIHFKEGRGQKKNIVLKYKFVTPPKKYFFDE